jgi:monoamine oxidase
MARTPLLRAVRRLAREHDAAERLGITPGELRQRRAAELSRRDFLKGAGAIVAVVTTSRIVPAFALAQPRIAIVGAGIAGLTAALKLKEQGLAATVYEASTRVGGRMHSELSYFADGQVSEICGELIDSNHKTILELAKQFSLLHEDVVAAQPPGSTDSNWFNNSRYSAAQADADFVPVRKKVQRDFQAAGKKTTFDTHTAAGEALDHMSVHDWIDKNVTGGHHSSFGRLLDAAYTIEFGDDTREQSSLNLVYMLAFQPSETSFSIIGTSDERFKIKGGNERLPQAIAGVLPPITPIKFRWRLSAVEARQDRTVALSFESPMGPQQVVADQVILAIPFMVLRTLDIKKAGFDALKLKAINELGAGRTAKLQLQFKKRLWNQNGPWGISNGNSLADLGFQDAWEVSRAQGGASGIINNFTGGDKAAALLASSTYARADTDGKVKTYAGDFLGRFETVFPGISAEWNGRATLSTAFRDPLFLCSYSYWKVGQYTAFADYERVAQGAIHFAGEHCDRDYQGFMEGGAHSGQRAAKEVASAVVH